MSYKFLFTGWSLHGPKVVHTQPVERCVSPVAGAQLYLFIDLFSLIESSSFVLFAHQQD